MGVRAASADRRNRERASATRRRLRAAIDLDLIAGHATDDHLGHTAVCSMKNEIPYPLALLYSRVGLPPPTVRSRAPDRIPHPYRGLLVHENNMTLTLEAHFGGRLLVRALTTCSRHGWYFRRVCLVLESSGRPVVMGAVKIRLDAFGARIRAQVLRNRVPLGRLLSEGGVVHKSRPTRFFEVTPNSEMMAVFWMPEPKSLYGRQTQMTVGGKHSGEIIEILAPA